VFRPPFFTWGDCWSNAHQAAHRLALPIPRPTPGLSELAEQATHRQGNQQQNNSAEGGAAGFSPLRPGAYPGCDPGGEVGSRRAQDWRWRRRLSGPVGVTSSVISALQRCPVRWGTGSNERTGWADGMGRWDGECIRLASGPNGGPVPWRTSPHASPWRAGPRRPPSGTEVCAAAVVRGQPRTPSSTSDSGLRMCVSVC